MEPPSIGSVNAATPCSPDQSGQKVQWKTQSKIRDVVILVAGFGAAGSAVGFVFGGPLGAIAGAIAGVFAGAIYAQYMSYHSYGEVVAEFDFNTRIPGEEDKTYISKYVPLSSGKEETEESEGLSQTEKDSGRFLGDLNSTAFQRALREASEPILRQRMTFASSQSLENVLSVWFKPQFCEMYNLEPGNLDVVQNHREEKSSIVHDIGRKRTILTSRLKVNDYTDGKRPKTLQRFEATVVFDWTTGKAVITKHPIFHSFSDIISRIFS